MTWSLDSSNFLEEISSLSHSIVFLYFFALITEEDFLISPCYLELSLKWVYVSFSPLSFASLLFSAICKASSSNHFAFLQFFFLGMVLVTTSVKCYEHMSIILQALCLPDLIPWIYLSPSLYNDKEFELGLLQWLSGFPYFLQFKPEFCKKELIIWATVNSRSCFCRLTELLHLWMWRT